MGIWSKCTDFLLYTNVWIAGAATALYAFSKYSLTESLLLDYTGLFVFFTCIWLYSLHRYIGLQKVSTLDIEDRFFKIKQLQNPIYSIGIISFLLSLLLIFTLSWYQILVMIVPGILSMLYVLPVFKRQRRLRDIHFIKIFVIALVWAVLTVLLPLAGCLDCTSKEAHYLLFIERFVFIFAITLPFDIRDLKVDAEHNVKTISAKIGTSMTWILCLTLLGLSTFIIGYLSYHGLLIHPLFWIHFATNFLTLICILMAFWRKHDWYYTGLLDGTMYLPFAILSVYIYLF